MVKMCFYCNSEINGDQKISSGQLSNDENKKSFIKFSCKNCKDVVAFAWKSKNISEVFRKVQSDTDMETFDNIWIPAWLEKGYELECHLGKMDRYIIKNPRQQPVGTVAFRPYNYDSPIDSVYPFKENNIIQKNIEKVYEIDYVSILKEHRRETNNLNRLLFATLEYCRIHNISYCIAILDYLFYRTLKAIYKIPMFPLEKKVVYEGSSFVPVIIDAHSVFSNLEQSTPIYEIYKEYAPFVIKKKPLEIT
jgi:hypothetical protein